MKAGVRTSSSSSIHSLIAGLLECTGCAECFLLASRSVSGRVGPAPRKQVYAHGPDAHGPHTAYSCGYHRERAFVARQPFLAHATRFTDQRVSSMFGGLLTGFSLRPGCFSAFALLRSSG